MQPDETVEPAESTLDFTKLQSVSEKKPTVAGYELAEKLGQGAFGAAYKATQERTGQSVAVKVLRRVNQRFEEELESLTQVSDHPHIVTLVDADLKHKPPFIVTPLLAGSLADKVPKNAEDVDIPQVSTWFRELAGALEFIHSRGTLHCDLKPANILLDEKGYARITDFGQATLQEGGESRMGSFWYMPIQQADGDSPQVRWDIYALGATIYALLTGRPPHSTKSARESLNSHSTVSEKIEEYRRLLQGSKLVPLRELNPRVDRELATIVEHCLRVDGGYSSAGELLSDLRRRQNKEPLLAAPFSYTYLLERLLARYKLSFLVGLVALTVLFSGFTFSAYEIYQARQAKKALILQQYERGQALIQQGKSIGLVWLLRAYRLEPREEFRKAFLHALARQPQIAEPFLYGLRTVTAPAPSGNWAIWRDPKEGGKKKRIDLRTGELSQLPPEIMATDRDQKDKVRYRLDDIELDPLKGHGGPATWRVRSFDSLQPGETGASLALLVSPERVLKARRTNDGIRVSDLDDKEIVSVHKREGRSPLHPTFSKTGELAYSFEAGGVVWRRSDGSQFEEQNFFGDIFCFSPDQQNLAASDGVSELRVWDRKGKVVSKFSLTTTANEIRFGPDSDVLLCSTRDGLVSSFSLQEGKEAWPPIQLEKPARWIYYQESGQVVTMSDMVIVWKSAEALDTQLREPGDLEQELARRTGWVYDETNAQIRMLSRDEYLDRFDGAF